MYLHPLKGEKKERKGGYKKRDGESLNPPPLSSKKGGVGVNQTSSLVILGNCKQHFNIPSFDYILPLACSGDSLQFTLIKNFHDCGITVPSGRCWVRIQESFINIMSHSLA